MQGSLLIILSLALPAAAVPVMALVRNGTVRKVFVYLFAAAMAANAVLAAVALFAGGSPITLSSETMPFLNIGMIVLDSAALIAIFLFGLKLRDWKIFALSIAQTALIVYVEIIKQPLEPQFAAYVDTIGLVMLMISSILGSLIAVFALGYMPKHEEETGKKARQPFFFAAVFLFLFAMNGICVTNNLMHFYTFWEITTLCSFLLIGYDKTEAARESADKALWINSVGGLFFIGGISVIVSQSREIGINDLVLRSPALFLTAGALLICCAGFVKSAQFPFQPWLLGAMVAPTPVSALLHSSTMVKAGVYAVLRLSPIFAGRLPGYMVAAVGGFTFMAASALAIGQSNGKKVLAYSTIANLGLIICCSGIGNAAALSAAVLLIIYHAVSKALMFLCVGTVEQKIGSRDIEDMFGIISVMPFTGLCMVVGMLSMMLPPFGVLVTKWMALEAAAKLPPILVLIVLGSAFTVAFWAKWLGAVLTKYKRAVKRTESLPFSMAFALGLIAALIPIMTALLPVLNRFIANSAVNQLYLQPSSVQSVPGGVLLSGAGGFCGVWALLAAVAALFILAALLSGKAKARRVEPYAGGEPSVGDETGGRFIGPMEKTESMHIRNYYFGRLFSEKRLTIPCALISCALMLLMIGVIL